MFSTFFKTIGAKGFKVKLKGKISAAGNSRKRSIMYRFGKCSYSSVNLKCLYASETVNTFTGVQGLQL
jgi:ribosomal protein S3